MGRDSASAAHIDHLGQPAVRLRTDDGSTAVIMLHGAQLVSWVPADGVERLYLSERAVFDEGQAIRGGVPVIFPQFERLGPDFGVPRHGIVRGRRWQVRHSGQRGDAVHVGLELSDDPGTLAQWPHRFQLELTVTLFRMRVEVMLSVQNMDAAAFGFTAALHTYLRVCDVERVGIEGLQGLQYRDSVLAAAGPSAGPGLQGAHLQTETDRTLHFGGETDRIYFDAAATLRVRESASDSPAPAAPPPAAVDVSMDGFEDAVIWNPGAAKTATLSDLPRNGFRQMVCVEAARIGRPVVLTPGQRWQGRQSLHTVADGQSERRHLR